MGKLDGRVALITGAGAGIGRDSALAFAREGAAVAVVDVRDHRAEQTASWYAPPAAMPVRSRVMCARSIG